jgi:hypothetical protein
MAKRPIVEIACTYCKLVFTTKEKNRRFCSVACKNSQQSTDYKGRKGTPRFGPDNPNFGKKWSDERRKAQSELVKSKVDEEYRRKCSTANKGVKFSPERIARMHNHRTHESYSHPHSDETKQIISQKSSEKFKQPGYMERYRRTKEERGYWIPKHLKSDYEVYFNESNWRQRMFDILYESNADVIREYGIYNAHKNSKGVVRDHMLSRYTGFTEGVFPELLRHVENCNIILHAENVHKRFSNPDSLTIDELFDRIANTKHIWDEQELCLILMEEYRNGKRWKRKEV